jgi:type III secretion system low calcium response chaperone LcrH/SycD
MKGSHGARGHAKKEHLHSAQQQEEKLGQALGDITNKMMKQGMSPKEAMGISNSYLENLYAQAYRLYNTGKYAEAVHLFRMLIMFNAMEPKYMLGLAASFHMLKEYVSAIQTYTMCSALDPQNPIPHYHSSDCFIQMKEYLSAMLCLELAIERAGDREEYAKMKERAQLSLESLKQQITSSPADEEPRSVKELQERAKKFNVF